MTHIPQEIPYTSVDYTLRKFGVSKIYLLKVLCGLRVVMIINFRIGLMTTWRRFFTKNVLYLFRKPAGVPGESRAFLY